MSARPENPVKRFLYVNRKAPHGTIYAMEALEALLVAAAFEQDVSVLFADDGVYQIVKDQNTAAIGVKDFSQAYRALKTYGIDKLYVEGESMRTRGLTTDDFLVSVVVLDSKRTGELMERQDVILNF